jgi:hypothetical protein
VLCGRPSPRRDVPATVVEYANESGARAMSNYLLGLTADPESLVASDYTRASGYEAGGSGGRAAH